MIAAQPGATNAIPGRVVCSVDVRHQSDAVRRQALSALRAWQPRRGVRLASTIQAEVPAGASDARLVKLLTQAAKRHQPGVPALVSGAGHDAAAMAAITPVAMLFVRCTDGVSHNPAESVRAADVAVAVATLRDFVESAA